MKFKNVHLIARFPRFPPRSGWGHFDPRREFALGRMCRSLRWMTARAEFDAGGWYTRLESWYAVLLIIWMPGEHARSCWRWNRTIQTKRRLKRKLVSYTARSRAVDNIAVDMAACRNDPGLEATERVLRLVEIARHKRLLLIAIFMNIRGRLTTYRRFPLRWCYGYYFIHFPHCCWAAVVNFTQKLWVE